MSTMTKPRRTDSRPPRAVTTQLAWAPPRRGRCDAAAKPAGGEQGRASGFRTLFSVPFHAALSGADAARVSDVLGMAIHLQPKLPALADTAGLARLDFFSGLFLLRGDAPDEWRLDSRTWGAPPPEFVHEWHLAASDAARLLDPTVRRPPRLNTIRPGGAK